MYVALTPKSRNRKTGPIPTSVTSSDTCPMACPWRGSGCYAAYGPVAWNWHRVTRGERGTDWASFCTAIANLPAGQLWRHNVAGDLPGQGDTIDSDLLAMLVAANRGKRGYTYTHKPMTDPDNRVAVKTAVDGGFTINLSADNLAEADELADLGIAPVVVVVPSAATNCTTPAGRKVVICPAQVHDHVTCVTCGLCAKPDRCAIVGLRAHGTKAAAVSAAAAL